MFRLIATHVGNRYCLVNPHQHYYPQVEQNELTKNNVNKNPSQTTPPLQEEHLQEEKESHQRPNKR
jgi:hypothetical protein